MKSITNLLIFTACTTFTSVTFAETIGKYSLGGYYTSNANLESTDANSDTYTRFDAKLYGSISENPVYFGIAWVNYSTQNSNDFLTATVSTETESSANEIGQFQIILKLFHRNYLSNSATTSDISFTHTGIGIDFEKDFAPIQKATFSAAVGYEGRHFPSFSNRIDNELHATGDVFYELNPHVKFSGFGGLGIIVSSLNEYARLFLDIGAGASGPITDQVSWGADLQLLRNTYLSRKVNQATEITDRRGRGRIVTSDASEASLLTIMQGTISMQLDPQFSLKGGIETSSQSSNNPINSYSNFEVFASVNLRY